MSCVVCVCVCERVCVCVCVCVMCRVCVTHTLNYGRNVEISVGSDQE